MASFEAKIGLRANLDPFHPNYFSSKKWNAAIQRISKFSLSSSKGKFKLDFFLLLTFPDEFEKGKVTFWSKTYFLKKDSSK